VIIIGTIKKYLITPVYFLMNTEHTRVTKKLFLGRPTNSMESVKKLRQNSIALGDFL
jgi:hypothetical protein